MASSRQPESAESCLPPEAVRRRREELLTTVFPGGAPRLWCPPLTHFGGRGDLDVPRIHSHLSHIAPYAKGLLVPGSTGEGWQMNDADIRGLLSVVLDAMQNGGMYVLVGVLKQTVADVLNCLEDTIDCLRTRTGATTDAEALSRSGVIGFTVCPPKGAHLSQAVIRQSLGDVLARGLPTALYQLPQVTENEVTPETMQYLAARHANLFFFKDTSGRDEVARATVDLGGVFLVRGAEGQYAGWLRSGGGPYDGLLLSSANVFAAELYRMISLLDSGRRDEAKSLAHRIESAVTQTFALVAGLTLGNPFTNANKILDHIMAYGQSAAQHDPPLLYSGDRLPAEYVSKAAELLHAAGLFPQNGYLPGY